MNEGLLRGSLSILRRDAMLSVIFTYCSIDDLPIDQSKTYQRLVRFYGQAFADSFTYEEATVVCNHPPPPERDVNGRFIGVIGTAS